MRTFRILTLVAIAVLGFTSCSNDDDTPTLLVVESETVTNLHAEETTDYTQNPPVSSGDFTKFDFSTGTTTSSDTDWDIAFRGTKILVNGGSEYGYINEPSRTGNAAAYVINSTAFGDVDDVDTTLFNQDNSNSLAVPHGSGNGWYKYSGPPKHLISPTSGTVLVFRTADGKYAKVQIRSYYKNSDSSSESQYYTFNYVYQPNDGVTTFE